MKNLKVFGYCRFPLKQRELIKSDIIEAFDSVYDNYDNKVELTNFVRNKTTSDSSKTRKMAKEFTRKYKGVYP